MRNPKLAILGVILTLLGSFVSIYYRIKVEGGNKATGLVYEMSVIEDAATTAGISVPGALKYAKDAGLTGVVISEDTINELLSDGEITVRDGIASTENKKILIRARFGLQARFSTSPSGDMGDGNAINAQPIPLDTLKSISLGLDPERCQMVRDAGLTILARHSNVPSCNASYVKAILTSSHELGATIYLPEGDQVLGSKQIIDVTASVLNELNMSYAAPEFAKLAGDAKLTDLRQENLIRLHSMQVAEATMADPAEFLERFTKAARERNIRLLLIRPINFGAISALENLLQPLRDLKAGLIKEGMGVKAPRPFVEPGVPTWAFPIIGMGVGLTCLWVGGALFAGSTGMALGILAAVGAAAGSLSGGTRPIAALICAMVFPVLANLWWERQSVRRPLVEFFAMTGISLVGGLGIAGFLNARGYYVRADQFMAVKLAHFFPILIIATIMVRRVSSFGEIMRRPVFWGTLLIGFVSFIGLGLMLARTGNDNPAAVSGIELKLRSILDVILYTRPRSKEFMIGHPALLVGLLLAARSNHRESQAAWVAILLSVGAIGQTSVVNTLCHLHTPILLSLARIAIGIVIGLGFGYAGWMLMQPTLKRAEANG